MTPTSPFQRRDGWLHAEDVPLARIAEEVGTPVYVAAIDAAQNRLVLGAKDDVLQATAVVEDVIWNDGSGPSEPLAALTQIRYNHKAAQSVLTRAGPNRFTVEFDEPQFAVTPGQLAAFYNGDTVLGAGWIGGASGEKGLGSRR